MEKVNPVQKSQKKVCVIIIMNSSLVDWGRWGGLGGHCAEHSMNWRMKDLRLQAMIINCTRLSRSLNNNPWCISNHKKSKEEHNSFIISSMERHIHLTMGLISIMPTCHLMLAQWQCRKPFHIHFRWARPFSYNPTPHAMESFSG